MTTKEIIAAFEQGAQANLQDAYRQGNLLHLSPPAQVIMTGDLHGFDTNFNKLVHYAQLELNPNRHLILHELLHGSMNDSADQCHSYLLFARAAQLKVRFPNQVHFLMGNHDMAQRCRNEVLKNGQPMVRALNKAISCAYADKSTLVMQALDNFIMSLPLAIRTENRIWLSHSLPSLRHLTNFDNSIFEKKFNLDDLQNNQSLHALAWDRVHSQAALNVLQKLWDVDFFIIGHQPQPQGYSCPFSSLVILASDHPHGRFLTFQLDHAYSPNELFALIKPIACLS